MNLDGGERGKEITPMHVYEARCYWCKMKMIFLDNSMAPNYNKDMAEEYKKIMKEQYAEILRLTEIIRNRE